MQASVSSMARPAASPAIDELDVGALGRSLWRKKRWIIGLTLAATALALAGVNLPVGTNNTTLSNQQLGEFNSQVGTARAQRIEAESKARFIREALRNGNAIEFSEIVNSDLMRRLSEQRVTLRTQLAEQSSTLLDQHPRIKELRAQIADLDRQLRVEADRLQRSFENDAQITAARAASLAATLDQLKRSAARTNEQDVQLRALEREAK